MKKAYLLMIIIFTINISYSTIINCQSNQSVGIYTSGSNDIYVVYWAGHYINCSSCPLKYYYHYRYSGGNWSLFKTQGMLGLGTTCEYINSKVNCSNISQNVEWACNAISMCEDGTIENVLNLLQESGFTIEENAFLIDLLIDSTVPESETQAQPNPYENEVNVAVGADPIVLNNGEYTHAVTDIIIPGRGIPIVISRTYGSKREYNGQFGYGWDMNYNMKLRPLHAENNPETTEIDESQYVWSVILVDGTGCKKEYSRISLDTDKLFNVDNRSEYVLINNSGTYPYTLITREGLYYDFKTNGNLSLIRDKNDNQIQLNYVQEGGEDKLFPVYGYSNYFLLNQYGGPENGKPGLIGMEYQLESITDNLNRTLSFQYYEDSDASAISACEGLLKKITDSASREWEYIYNPNNNALLEVKSPSIIDPDNGTPYNPTTKYLYDNPLNPTTITGIIDPAQYVESSPKPYLKNIYDYLTNTLVTQEYGNENINMVGCDYSLTYDPDNHCAITESREKTSYETTTQSKSYTVTAYNDAGQTVSETIVSNPIAGQPNAIYQAFTTAYDYNQYNEVTKVILPKRNCVEYVPDYLAGSNGFNLTSMTIIQRPECDVLPFNGTNDYVTIADASGRYAFGGLEEDFSIAFWVKRLEKNREEYLLDRRDVNGYGWHLYFKADNTLEFQMLDADDTVTVTSNTGIEDSRWHYIVASVNRNVSSGSACIYIDGGSAESATPVTITIPKITSTATDMYIGRSHENTQKFTGSLDELMFFDQSLWRDMSDQHCSFHLSKSMDGLINHWEDDPVVYNGSSDFTEISDTSGTYSFNETDKDFSVVLWVKRNRAGQEEVLVDKRDSTNDGWCLKFDSTNHVVFCLDAIAMTSTTTITDDTQWHSIVVSIDRDGVGVIYIDKGLPEGVKQINKEVMEISSTRSLIFGKRSYSTSSYYFSGSLWNIMILGHAIKNNDSSIFGLSEYSQGLIGYWKMDDNAADTVVTNVVTGKPNGAASRNTEDMVADGKVPGEIRTVSSFVQHNGLDYVRSVIGAKGYHATYRYDFDTDSEKPGNLVDVYMPGIEYYQRESGVFVPYITKDFGETGAVPVMHFTYDVHGQIDTITTAEGMVTKFEYYLDSDAQLQRRGRIKQLIIDYGSAPHKNIITEYDYNYVFNADYNAMMYVNTVTQDKGDTTKLNITAQTLYNNLVQLIECIHPVLDGQAVGYKTKYDYTKNGKLWKAKRNFTDGQSTTRTQIVEYSYNLLDNLNTFTDSLGRVTTTNYDNNENVINIVDPKGAINNYWTDIAYDFRDLMEKTTDAEGNETTYAYDANGNLKSIKDAKNQTTTYDYDSYDRLILTTYADNTSTEQYAYDSDGDGITRNTSRTGDKFYSDYDGMGRLIRKIIDKASVTPHVVIVDNTSSAANWSLEDNANGKYGNDCLVTKTVDAFHTFEVTSVNLSSGDYQVYMRWPDIATANSVSVEVLDGMATLATLTINQAQKQGQWNLLGNYIISGSNTVSVKITAQGSSTVTCADAIRLVPTILPQTKYYYDISGKVLQIAQDSSTIDYEYDTLGRLNKTTDQNTNIVRYDYDNLGRRTQLVYPDESSIAYVYDKMNRLTDIIDDFSENVIVHYDYDELSRRKALYYNYDGDGDYDETGVDGIISYDYEDMVEANNDNLGNRLESVKHDINNDATYDLTYAYTYDTVGNCETKIIDGTETHSYLYDNIYQITQDQKTGGDKYNWVYDVVGSWDELKLNDVTQTDFCSWNNDDTVNNLLNQYGSVGPSGARVDYDYDSNGNLTSDGTYAYVYDPQNRLTDIYNGITLMVSYSYDARGRRISKTIYSPSTLMTKYCYDGDQVIAEYDGSDTLLRKYIYGPGIDEPICMIRYIAGVEDGRYFYHQDALGSVAALSQFDSGSASFVETYRYTAFGQTIICDGSGNPRTSNHSAYDNPCMFTGREYETLDGNNLKLYYYRARFYKPEIGRFLQTDPIGYTDNMNLYQYCGNNSINLVDPMGLCKEGYGYGASWSAFWSTIENRLSNIHNFWCGGNAWNNLGNWTIDFLGNVYDFEVMLKDSLYDIGENPAIVYNTLYEFGFHSNEIYLNDIANKTDAELCAMVANLTFDFETAVVTTSAAQKLSSLRLIKKPAGPRVGVCFTADTEVLTPNGEIEICQIQPGDEVWGYNFATGQTEICHVTRVFERTTGCITIISVGSETIETTPEHPFWICDVGWKLAGQLNVGDLLYGIDGSGLPVLNVTQKDEQATVYNFEVENAHTYYVSQESILVHNNPCAEPFGPIDLTKGGAKKIRNLTNMKDMKAADAIRARGGGASQINQLQTGYEKLTVGDLANKAAAGDRAAETAIKIIKQASKKAQKY